MKRSIKGACPYSPKLLQTVGSILDKTVKFPGDLRAVLRALYVCSREQDLVLYQDLTLGGSDFVRDKLKPILLDAYRTYSPDAVRGSFCEALICGQIRDLHSGKFEISRWVLYGDISPLRQGCSAKSVDIFESGDSCEVAVECKIRLEIWLKNLKITDDHLPCFEALRKNHKDHALRLVFATFDPPEKLARINSLLSETSFAPDSILFRMALPDW